MSYPRHLSNVFSWGHRCLVPATTLELGLDQQRLNGAREELKDSMAGRYFRCAKKHRICLHSVVTLMKRAC